MRIELDALKEINDYKNQFILWLDSMDLTTVFKVANVIFERNQDGKSVFVCGNGGSASLSQHFAVDLGVGTSKVTGERGIKISDLTSNAAIVTATANDKSYNHVFEEQLKLSAYPMDILIAISSSGKSENIIRAVQHARKNEITTIGITGFDGGSLKDIVDYSIHVETRIGEYGRVEDIHSFVLHLITNLVRKRYDIN